MICFRFDVQRRGVPITELQLLDTSAPEISFKSNAAIKMTLAGQFGVPAIVNFATDTVCPLMIIDGKSYPLGKFIITDPADAYDGGSYTTVLSGFDMTYRAQLCSIERRQSYAAGTLYTDVLRRLLVESGISTFFIEPSNATLQTTREDWEPGTPRLTIANDLLAEMNYRSLWADRDGIVRAQAYSQPTAKNIAHEYRHGQPGVLLPQLQRTRNTFELPNVFVVMVDSPDYPAPLTATAENNNPASPISTVSRNMRVPLIASLDNIASQAHLQAYADNLCIKNQIATETITVTTALEAMHGCADVMALYHNNVSGIYEEIAWSMGASPTGTYEHTARKVLYL